MKDHGGVLEDNEYYRLDAAGNRIGELTQNQALKLAIANFKAKFGEW